MISKELIANVFYGDEADESDILDIYFEDRDEVVIFWKDHNTDRYNVHELADKVKKWAFIENKYEWFISFKTYGGGCCEIQDNHTREIKISFDCDTEQAAIFKAGKWKLDNKNEN